MKKWIIFFSAVLCFFMFSVVPIRAESAAPLKIGATGPMTGPWGIWGQNIREGALIAAEEINSKGGILGRKVEIIVADDEGTANKAMTEMKRIVQNDKIEAIVGPSTTGAATMVNPWLSEVAHIPQIMASASGTMVPHDKWRYCFKAIYSDDRKVDSTIEQLKTKGIKKIAVLYQNDQWGINLRDYVLAGMKKYGMELLEIKVFEKAAFDVTGQMQQLMAKDPDIILCLCMDPEFATIIKTANKLKITDVIFWGSLAAMPATVADLLPAEVYSRYQDKIITMNSKNMIYSESDPLPEATKALLDKVEKRFGIKRRGFDNLTAAYDAIYLFKIAFEKAGSTNPEAFREAMESGFVHHGVLTDYRFSPTDHMAHVEVDFAKATGVKNLDIQAISKKYVW